MTIPQKAAVPSPDTVLKQAHLKIERLQNRLSAKTSDLTRTKEMLAHSLKQISLMVAEREETMAEMRDLTQTLAGDQAALVSLLTGIIESKSGHLRGHSEKVADISVFIAREEALPDGAVRDIETAARLHEIGKLFLPDAVWAKAEKDLTERDRDLLSQHPVKGAALLGKISGFKKAAQIIRHVHEKVNGMGFPDGLKQRDIPIGARIIAAANIYDRLVYRSTEGDANKALAVIEHKVGSALDGQMVFHLYRFAEKHPKRDAEKIKVVDLFDLQPGMELAAGIFTLGGAKLLPVDTVLTDETIRQVAHYAKGEPVRETVFIK
jgi:response regulator RpfG family c-di-GMP phosphodiesterase